MQTINTNLRTALIEGADSSKVVNYAHDFTDLLGEVRNPYGFFQTLGGNLQTTGSENGSLTIKKGVAFVKYEKTSGEIGFLKIQLTSDQVLDLGAETDGDFFMFFNLDQEALDNGGDTVDGNDISEIKVDTIYPEKNFLPIAKITKAEDIITMQDLRERQKPTDKMYEFGLEYLAGSLVVSIEGGIYNSEAGRAESAELTLESNSMNYLEINSLDGTITSNATGFTNIPLYKITTNANGVESVEDVRLSMLVVSQSTPIATETEAEAGTDNTKMMTPLNTKQSIEANKNISDENVDILTSGSTSDASDLHTHANLGMFVSASENLRVSSNAEIFANPVSYSDIKPLKSLRTYKAGTIRIKFEAYYTSNSASVMIYVNGVQVVSQSVSSAYIQYSKTISVGMGDVIELKCKSNGSSGAGVYVRNMGMYCDLNPNNMFLFGS